MHSLVLQPRSRTPGFTLVEVLVTLAIVGILAAVAMPLAELAVKRNKEHELRSSLRQIREALDAHKQAVAEGRIAKAPGESGYPRSLEQLVKGTEDRQSTTGQKLVFLRHIPRDPFFTDSTAAASITWGKRSYASSAEDPKEGADVFDVYSLSPDVGLNGILYRDW